MKRLLAALVALMAFGAGPAFADATCTTTQPCPNNAPANVRPVRCTLTTTNLICGPFTPNKNQDYHLNHAPTGFTASCQVEEMPDGTNWAIQTVTASGSTTQMENPSFSNANQATTDTLSEAQGNVPVRFRCLSITGGSDAVSFTQ